VPTYVHRKILQKTWEKSMLPNYCKCECGKAPKCMDFQELVSIIWTWIETNQMLIMLGKSLYKVHKIQICGMMKNHVISLCMRETTCTFLEIHKLICRKTSSFLPSTYICRSWYACHVEHEFQNLQLWKSQRTSSFCIIENYMMIKCK